MPALITAPASQRAELGSIRHSNSPAANQLARSTMLAACILTPSARRGTYAKNEPAGYDRLSTAVPSSLYVRKISGTLNWTRLGAIECTYGFEPCKRSVAEY